MGSSESPKPQSQLCQEVLTLGKAMKITTVTGCEVRYQGFTYAMAFNPQLLRDALTVSLHNRPGNGGPGSFQSLHAGSITHYPT